MSALRNAGIEALDQMHSLIVTAKEASGPTNDLYADSGIGRHVRHVVDHFLAFRRGIDTGVIDYNVRRRDCTLERRADLGLAVLQELREWLQFLQASIQIVTVESEISCLQRDNRQCESTFDRELMYLISHTIHHAAYAALLLRQIGLQPDALVGYAPATVSYLRQIDARSK